MRCEEYLKMREEGLEASDGRFAGHLSACPHCSALERSLSALEDGLLELGREKFEPPPFLAARIKANLEAPAPGLAARLREFFAPRRLAYGSLVAVAFVAGIFARDFMNPETVSTVAAIPEKVEAVAEEMAALPGKVVFEFEAPEGDRVGLVGDFNEWGKKSLEMETRQADGRWIFELSLPPGRYQYAFEVNGKKWLPDPRSKGIIPDGFGGINSVLYVPSEAGLVIM